MTTEERLAKVERKLGRVNNLLGYARICEDQGIATESQRQGQGPEEAPVISRAAPTGQEGKP